jgi:hypothetical protein
MTADQLTIESLRRWSHVLLWISIVLPLLGAIAAGARYYVERHEKQLSSRLTAAAVNSARTEAGRAQQELSELKVNLRPRHLSQDQRSQLVAELKDAPKLTVEMECAIASGPDAMEYADEIRGALVEAGWDVSPVVYSTRAPVNPGIELVQRNRGPALPSTQALLVAFGSVGVVLTPLHDTPLELAENRIRIFVGTNPIK